MFNLKMFKFFSALWLYEFKYSAYIIPIICHIANIFGYMASSATDGFWILNTRSVLENTKFCVLLYNILCYTVIDIFKLRACLNTKFYETSCYFDLSNLKVPKIFH